MNINHWFKWLCPIFGHRSYFDTCNVAGSSTCCRCGHKNEAIKWPPMPPMPECKPAKKEEYEN
jgi:hypothetical protein